MANQINVFDHSQDLLNKVFEEIRLFDDESDYTYDSTETWNSPEKDKNLFFINAISYKKFEVQHREEEVKRRTEYEHFKEGIESLVEGLHSEHARVDSYEKMQTEFKNYLKDTPKNHNPSHIALVFLGHGSSDGAGDATLCFADGEWPNVNKAFEKMYEIHKKSGIRAHLKIVFSQCYSHQHNIKTKCNAEWGVYLEPDGLDDIKFMYLSCPDKKKTKSTYRFTCHKDKDVILLENELIVDDYVDKTICKLSSNALQDYIQNNFNVTLKDQACYDWFTKNRRPNAFSNQFVPDIEKKIRSLKAEIKLYLHLEIPPYSQKAAKYVSKYRKSGFPFDEKKIGSVDDLKKSIKDFIKRSNKSNNPDKPLPNILIIFISCRQRVNKHAGKHKLAFPEKQHISMEDILKIANSSEKDVRVTFFCENVDENINKDPTSDHFSIYSNSYMRIVSGKHMQLGQVQGEIAKGFES